jgi:thiosulfate dehydrogenase [quinone] large subunit
MDNGQALLEYWQRGLKTAPKPVISYDWYRSFIEFLVNSEAHTWFSKIIIFGELAIAIALILGAFTGLAAFFGGLMNWSFIMARIRFHEWNVVRDHDMARLSLEKCRLDWP